MSLSSVTGLILNCQRAFRRLQSRDHDDPRVDADGGAQGDHFVWNIFEHPMPRALPSSRFSEVRVSGFVAHAGFLRANRRVVPPCAGDAGKATILGGSAGRALADRLAAHESRVVTRGQNARSGCGWLDGDFCDSYYSSPNTVMCQLTVFARFQSRPYCLWRWRSQHQWGFPISLPHLCQDHWKPKNGPDCSEPS